MIQYDMFSDRQAKVIRLGDKTTSVFRVFANSIDRRPLGLPEALSVQSVLLSFRKRSFGIFFFLFVGDILRHLQTLKILNPFPTENIWSIICLLLNAQCFFYTCADAAAVCSLRGVTVGLTADTPS